MGGETGIERWHKASKVKELVSGEPRITMGPKSELLVKGHPASGLWAWDLPLTLYCYRENYGISITSDAQTAK